MNCLQKTAVLFSFLILFSGCASIVSKSNWPFSVDSNPSGASFVITNKRGQEVYKGKTPAAMKLKSGAGFFSKESYRVTFQLKGYDTKTVNVECKLNAWYAGNIVFGGLIGALIIDPMTGAMYKLDSQGITETLSQATTGGPSLRLLDKNALPQEWQSHLVKISE